MSYDLSILIPSLRSREHLLYPLYLKLLTEIDEWHFGQVEIILDIDNGEKSIGAKRQYLLEQAKGAYVVFIDDDDDIHKDYLFDILKGLACGVDIVTFDGYMTTNGHKREKWFIAKDLPYLTTFDAHGNREFLRYPNHLAAIKRNIALQIGYKDMRHGEDYDYATRLKDSGLIQTEYHINKELYHYKYITNK